ncbi:MAG TPA: SCO family protein [Verrucomicrobiae bacterium]|jgi:protein SCO1/2|nr:SCO family protein [Verrucomicrobiae bacterium]
MLPKRWAGAAGFTAVSIAVAAFLLFCARPVAANGPDNSHFPNVELITQDGKKVHFYDDLIKGRIVAIVLIYTNCQYSCPLETARLAQVQKKLGDRVGKDIFFYSISIDPAHDTPAVLKEYMQKFRIGPGWTFLTGKKEDIDFLSKQLGLYADPSVNADGHLAQLLIGNETTGEWIRGSALDNPSFQARMIGDFLDNFKHLNPDEAKSSSDGRPLENFDKGQYIFGRDCLACHTIGHGDTIGPDLLGVTHVREGKWLARIIQAPDQLLKEDDPMATALLAKYKNVRMPNLGVGDADLHYLIEYLEARTLAHDKEAAAAGSSGAAKPGTAEKASTKPNW